MVGSCSLVPFMWQWHKLKKLHLSLKWFFFLDSYFIGRWLIGIHLILFYLQKILSERERIWLIQIQTLNIAMAWMWHHVQWSLRDKLAIPIIIQNKQILLSNVRILPNVLIVCILPKSMKRCAFNGAMCDVWSLTNVYWALDGRRIEDMKAEALNMWICEVSSHLPKVSAWQLIFTGNLPKSTSPHNAFCRMPHVFVATVKFQFIYVPFSVKK